MDTLKAMAVTAFLTMLVLEFPSARPWRVFLDWVMVGFCVAVTTWIVVEDLRSRWHGKRRVS